MFSSPLTAGSVSRLAYFWRQVGPHAVNLAGGQAASLRIAADIMRRRARLIGVESNTQLHSYAPLLESYVQQMHGLMWL